MPVAVRLEVADDPVNHCPHGLRLLAVTALFVQRAHGLVQSGLALAQVFLDPVPGDAKVAKVTLQSVDFLLQGFAAVVGTFLQLGRQAGEAVQQRLQFGFLCGNGLFDPRPHLAVRGAVKFLNADSFPLRLPPCLAALEVIRQWPEIHTPPRLRRSYRPGAHMAPR